MPTRRAIATLAAIAVLLTGLAAPLGALRGEDRLAVLATTGMIADAARAVGGDQVAVEALMGPGVDPHAYRQTRSDLVALSRADLVLWHGLYLEAQMEEVLRDLAGRGRNVVAVAETLPADRLIAHDDYPDRRDPHVWMDPALWADVVVTIEQALSTASPDATDRFAENAATYAEQIEALAAYSDTALATVPETARVLVTAHDAFNYFGAAYGFEVVGIQGISTESEAGLQRIAELVD
ncbi:MAG: zinc ABC transporter substrate-binding protein, partial [Pseudomonadota bacterium]